MTDENRGRQRRWRRGKTNDSDSSPIQILITVGGGGAVCDRERCCLCWGRRSGDAAHTLSLMLFLYPVMHEATLHLPQTKQSVLPGVSEREGKTPASGATRKCKRNAVM